MTFPGIFFFLSSFVCIRLYFAWLRPTFPSLMHTRNPLPLRTHPFNSVRALLELPPNLICLFLNSSFWPWPAAALLDGVRSRSYIYFFRLCRCHTPPVPCRGQAAPSLSASFSHPPPAANVFFCVRSVGSFVANHIICALCASFPGQPIDRFDHLYRSCSHLLTFQHCTALAWGRSAEGEDRTEAITHRNPLLFPSFGFYSADFFWLYFLPFVCCVFVCERCR